LASAPTAAAEPAWLAARREAAAAAAAELELPMFKDKPGWEFTELEGLDLDSYAPSRDGNGAAAPAAVFTGLEGALEVTQVDGAYSADGAAAGEAIVLPLSVAVERHPELVERHFGSLVGPEDVFAARNEAGWSGGLFVHVPRGVRLEAPVLATAIQAAGGSALDWRTLIVLEEEAEAEVWEQFLGADSAGDGLFNVVTEIVVGANARLRYVGGQELSEKAWIFGTQRAHVDRHGELDWVALGFGSGRGRVLMNTRLVGDGAEARVTGAYATRGRQHVDFDTTQEHAAPHTTSDLAFRGILDGRSTAVWRGMILVDPGAQQTDAFQESRNLLLSKKAHADAIPGLEILANDVRCTHAAAIAQIDKEQLFYLRSRGLRLEVAQRLVIEGFMQALMERFPEGPVRETIGAALDRRLGEILG
jgi:Fe-S cluster assembly protein SufD